MVNLSSRPFGRLGSRAGIAAAAAYLLLVVTLGACGGDDDDGAPAVGDATNGSITVEARDNHFNYDQINAATGPLSVTLVEKGVAQHTFQIKKVDDFKLEVSNGEKSASGTVNLDAGTYRYYCSVPGHEAQMHGDLVVK